MKTRIMKMRKEKRNLLSMNFRLTTNNIHLFPIRILRIIALLG